MSIECGKKATKKFPALRSGIVVRLNGMVRIMVRGRAMVRTLIIARVTCAWFTGGVQIGCIIN